jgi:hypothetical protein
MKKLAIQCAKAMLATTTVAVSDREIAGTLQMATARTRPYIIDAADRP